MRLIIHSCVIILSTHTYIILFLSILPISLYLNVSINEQCVSHIWPHLLQFYSDPSSHTGAVQVVHINTFFLPFPAFQWLKTGSVTAIRTPPFLWWSDIYSSCVAALPANLASRLCCLKHHHRDQAARYFSGFRFWSIWSISISFRCRLQVSALLSLS